MQIQSSPIGPFLDEDEMSGVFLVDEEVIGIACLPDFVVARRVEDGTLVQILSDHTANAGTFRLLWPSARYASPKLTAFTEFMAKHLFGVTMKK